MLRKSQQEDSRQSTNRNKLPLEAGIRSLAGIKELLALAEESKGSQIELAWTTKNPDQVFVLDVQWDANQKEPFWSLYEENANKSKRLWAQPFSVDNMEMFYDVLVMSCGAVDPSKNLSEILKPKQEKEDASKYSPVKNPGNPAAEPAANSHTAAEPSPQPGVNTNLNPAVNVSPNVIPIPAFDPNTGFMPAYPFPPGAGVPVNPLGGLPMPNYNMPPQNMPQMPMPYPSNPGVPVNPGMVAMPGWQYAPLPSGNNPYFQGAPVLNQPGSLNSMPFDTNLLNKQSDIALVDLLIKAQLLTEPVLAAALKMQEFVQEQKINVEKAAKILKVHHSKGDAIGEYIDSPIGSSATGGSADSGKFNRAAVPVEPKIKSDDKELSAAFELLIKASLLSAGDIETAQGVSRKHGGDVVSILEAAKKIDANTLEAAKICHALEKSGLMKLEKCVMALNYCSRSRVTFDEALSELNWENPRHLQK